MAQVTTLLTRAGIKRVSGRAGLPPDGKGAAAEPGDPVKNAEHDPRLYKVFKAKGLSGA